MPSVIQQRNIPEVIRALSGMDSPDYIDLFTVTTNGAADATPLQWSRTAIEDVAGLGGQFIWRGVLGLRLNSRPSTEQVGGWKIADRGEDWIRLEASSWFLTAHLVIRLDDEHLSVGTFIRYDRPIATLIWVPASAVHRRLMPGLLHQTVRLKPVFQMVLCKETTTGPRVRPPNEGEQRVDQLATTLPSQRFPRNACQSAVQFRSEWADQVVQD